MMKFYSLYIQQHEEEFFQIELRKMSPSTEVWKAPYGCLAVGPWEEMPENLPYDEIDNYMFGGTVADYLR